MSINCEKQMEDGVNLNDNIAEEVKQSTDDQLGKQEATPPSSLFPHELFKNRNTIIRKVIDTSKNITNNQVSRNQIDSI